MSDIDKCREAFEAWRQSLGEEAEDLRREGDGYYMYDAHQAWHGWQAAWNAAQPKPPAANTVRVRIPVAVNSQDHWYARRWANDSDGDALQQVVAIYSNEDATQPVAVSWIVADVLKPEVAEVRGEVTT